MPKFSLLQMGMVVSLIAILLSITQVEGCGKREQWIDAIHFSKDDSRILVSSINGRLARFDGYRELEHLARTVVWLDSNNGSTRQIVHRDYRRYAPYIFAGGILNSVALNPSNDQVAAIELGGQRIALDIKSEDWLDGNVRSDSEKMLFSRNGKYLASNGLSGVQIIDVAAGSRVLNIPLEFSQFMWCMFSRDESHLILSMGMTTDVWDLENQLMTKSTKSAALLQVLAAIPDDTLFTTDGFKLQQCDTAGKQVVDIAQQTYQFARVSKDGSVLVACDKNNTDIYRLNDHQLQRTVPYSSNQVAISSDGSLVALGLDGQVLLLDTLTGKILWKRVAPSRFGTPWYLPILMVALWIWIARRYCGWNFFNFRWRKNKSRLPNEYA